MINRETMQKIGNKNAIFELQQMLYNINRYRDGEPKILPDGIFGSETTRAVKSFQQREGLDESGRVDYETWNAISEKHKEIEELKRKPLSFEIFAEELYNELKMGDSHDAVFMLQILFNKLAERFIEFENAEISGNFDAATHRNVVAFQEANRFEPDGRVDKKVWNRAAMYYNSFK